MLPTMYLTGVLVATLCALVVADPQTPPQEPQDPQDQGDQGEVIDHWPAGVDPTGGDQSQNFDSADDGHSPLQMSKFCFFGKFPSATCSFRCHLMNMLPMCLGADSDHVQSGEGKCVCKPRPAEPEAQPEAVPQEIFSKPETHKEQEAEKKKPEGGEKKPGTGETQESTFTIPMHTAPQESEEEQPKHHVVFYVFDLNKVFGPQNNATGPQEEPAGPQTAPAGWAVQHLIALLIILLLVVLIALELYACHKKQRARSNDMETIFKNIPMPNKA